MFIMSTEYPLLLRADRAQTPAVQLKQLVGIIFGLGRRSRACKSHAGRGRASVACGHGDKLHQIECDIFVAAGSARTCGGGFFHDSFSSSGNDGDLFVVVFEILQAANNDAIHDDGRMTLSAMIAEGNDTVQASPNFSASWRTRLPLRMPWKVSSGASRK